MKNVSSCIFSGCEGLSNDDIEVARGNVFQEMIRPGAGFKTGDFVKRRIGGATVERPFPYLRFGTPATPLVFFFSSSTLEVNTK